VVQADTLLHEAFANQSRITGLDADRGSSANAVEKPIAIVDRLHAEFRQELAVEGPSQVEPAHCQDDMGHSIDLDRHRPCPLV
jgi:hypothetical protein